MNCMWQFALPWDILKGGNEERGQHLGCNAFLNKVGQGMKIGFLAGTGVFVSIIQKDFRWALFCVCNLSCQFWGDWKCGTVFHFVLSVTTVGGSLVIVEVGREIGFKWVSALVCIPLLHAEKESETINKSWFYWGFLYFVIFCQYGRLNLLWSSWHIQTEQSFFLNFVCPYGVCIMPIWWLYQLVPLRMPKHWVRSQVSSELMMGTWPFGGTESICSFANWIQT